ncbi:MAG: hypothetical protein HY874_08900 [Chloroflexi bacterium]|nr:hypothetical protein [Chloroflexota bacterium]
MASEAQLQSFTCIVCAEGVDVRMSAECNWCDGRYHLNQRNDIEAKDCGEVWIDEQYLALQFACLNCLTGPAAASRGIEPAPTRKREAAPRQRRYRKRA